MAAAPPSFDCQAGGNFRSPNPQKAILVATWLGGYLSITLLLGPSFQAVGLKLAMLKQFGKNRGSIKAHPHPMML